MTNTATLPVELSGNGAHLSTGLTDHTARLLAGTSRTAPRRQQTPLWLLKKLNWVDVATGTRRRNETARDAHGREIGVDIALHDGNSRAPSALPTAIVSYNPEPPEHDLLSLDTVLKIPARLAHLYNGGGFNQTEEQIRLVIQAIREQQQHVMVNHDRIGLLHTVAPDRRISASDSDNVLDAMDELLGRCPNPHFILAHRKAIVALGQECTRRGLQVDTLEVDGRRVPVWRGLPVYPCDALPIADNNTSIVVLRTGESHDDAAQDGVVGLHQTGLPDEWEPSVNVTFMGVDHTGLIHYLISAYFNVDVLLPDALAVLDDIPLSAGIPT